MVTPYENFPTKSRAYLYAQSVFHVQFNDVDFYVEDADKESLYYSILSRLFPDVRIDRIFPLGGKRAVIDHAQNNRASRKSVYILDKDFDDLLGILVSLQTVVYLDRFCIENYVLEPLAICRFVVAERPTLTEQNVWSSFDIPEFIRTAIRDLRTLFFHFFKVQKHGLALENCGMPVARFTRDNRQWQIDEAKVTKYQEQVVAKAAAAAIDLSTERKLYFTDFEMRRRRLVGRNVSGKYLLALLLRRISRLFNVPGTSLESATFRLTEYCELSALRDFRDQVSKRLSPARRKPKLATRSR
jgi:hypothetical protein